MRTMTVLLLLAIATAAAAQTRVYQWTDEDGVVHFSTEPPPDPDQEVEARMVRETPKPGSVIPEVPGRELPETAAGAGPAGGERQNPEEQARLRAERCRQWQQIVATIEPARRIQKTEPDGSVTFLSGDDRIAELERARQMVAENCD